MHGQVTTWRRRSLDNTLSRCSDVRSTAAGAMRTCWVKVWWSLYEAISTSAAPICAPQPGAMAIRVLHTHDKDEMQSQAVRGPRLSDCRLQSLRTSDACAAVK